jgi:glycosyltransferase involved in cell wall biosynthesis
MRPVIHVVDSLGLGGCQTCLKAMMEHAHGPRQHYVVSLRYTEPHVEINRGPVLCARSSSRFSPLSLLPLLRLARQLRDPIIHCYLFRSQVYGYLVKSLDSRCRLILHEGGRIVQREHEPAWERVAYRAFLRTARRSTDMFLANSHYTMSRLEAAGHRGRLQSRVVYNCILTETPGLDPARREAARAKLGLPPSAFAIGFAGRLVERKGWRDFVAAAEALRGRTDVHWLVAGTGPEQAALEHELKERKLTQVRLLGFQSDMDSFYRALDLCIVPSHWEPHGLVQIEAQGRGVAVLVSNVPGMAETVNEGVDALLFEPQNMAALVARVNEVLDSHDLRNRLSAGSIANAEKFTIQHFHEQLENCYRLL